VIHGVADLGIPAFWTAVLSIVLILVCQILHDLTVLFERWFAP